MAIGHPHEATLQALTEWLPSLAAKGFAQAPLTAAFAQAQRVGLSGLIFESDGEKKMIKFYYNLAPNPTKVALCLEEMGLPYEAIPVDTRKGEQHTPQYLAINPNAKVPAIVDGDATVFDSNAILLYLAEKTGQFTPGNSAAARGEMLSWLKFVASGIGLTRANRCISGTSPLSPRTMPSTATRSRRSATGVFSRLGSASTASSAATSTRSSTWRCGVGRADRPHGAAGPEAMKQFPNLQRHMTEISARPAAQRALALKEKHSFKTEMDDTARLAMFPPSRQEGGLGRVGHFI